MADIQQIASDNAFLVTDIITYRTDGTLDRNEKLKVFNVLRERYTRLLRNGRSIPSNETSLLQEAEDISFVSGIAKKYIQPLNTNGTTQE